MDDSPISEAGYWLTYDAEADIRRTMGEAGFAEGWALYQGSNSWGNAVDGGDNALMGSYLMFTAQGLDQFIAEADIHTHDNDGVGFIFGFQDMDHHFVAHEVNDQWPSEGNAADGVSGPCMKIRERHGAVPTDQPMTGANNAYTILPSNDGDDGLAVNKAGYTPYPETSWFKIGIKVVKSGRGTYSFTFQSTRPDQDHVTASGWTIEKVTGHSSSYTAGLGGIFEYAEQLTIDNIRVTPLQDNVPVSEYVSFCNGRGHCAGEHAYHESPGENAYLPGCADDCRQFNTLAECENHCTTLGHACGGCTLEFQKQGADGESVQGGGVDDGNWNHCVTDETIMEIDPSLLPANDWVPLTADRINNEHACDMFKYRYAQGDFWYESPPTAMRWDYSNYQEVTGTWTYGEGDATTSTFECTGGEGGCNGIGCSNGGGDNTKVLPWCSTDADDSCVGCGVLPPAGSDTGSNHGTNTICQNQPGIFDAQNGGGGCADAEVFYQCADATPPVGCWKFETRAGNTFGNSPYREKSWKKQDYTCDCGCAPHVQVNGEERYQNTFVDCSRSYVGMIRGCSDPAATNYDAKAELHDHSCQYGWEHGALDFSFSGDDSPGHVAVRLGVDDLPAQAITAEFWVRINQMSDWAAGISAIQDDSANEFGFVVIQCPSADRPNGSGNTDWCWGLSTVGADADQGDSGEEGRITYLQAPQSAIAGTEGEWHHVAGTYDGTTQKLLIDGREVATATTQHGDINYPHPNYLQRVNQIHGGWFTLGAYNDANEYYAVNGVIDDVRLWNVARSGAEITAGNCADPCAYGADPADPCVAGLMHFWKFDESFGSTISDQVNDGADGTLMGTVVRVEHALCETTGCTDQTANNFDRAAGSYDHSCEYDTTGALDFTHTRVGGFGSVAHVGVPDVQIGDGNLPVADMTVECWVKFMEPFTEWAGCVSFAQDDGSTEYGVFLSARAATATGAQLSFALSSTGAQLRGGSQTGEMTYVYGPETQVGAGEWIHWAGVYNANEQHFAGDSMKVYLNGQLAKTDGTQFGDINYPPAGYTASAGGWFTLGAYHDANEYYPLNGMQDDTRLWNVARTADQISSSYCGELGRKAHGLLGYWKFDETEGDTCTNEKHGAPDGVLMGDVFRTAHDVTAECGGGH
jgi:hypothetical protein